MCELFGLCSNKEVGISFSWRGFVRRGEKNPSGWGVGWYVKNEKGKIYAALVKEPRPSVRSPVAQLLGRGIRSHIVISHVRLATEGSERYVNTHPFVRLVNNSEWIFAHNGTVSIKWANLKRYHPIGETDSEYAFCYILDNISDNNLILDGLFRRMYEVVEEISDFGKFNFLMSDGEYLFAHTTDGNLHYLIRHPPHKGIVRLRDEDFEVSLEEMKKMDEYVVLLATRPLTRNEDWVKLKRRKIYVFRDGDPILLIKSDDYVPMIDEKELEVLRVVRTSPHSLELSKIADYIGEDVEGAYKIVERLVHKNYLKQHSYDRVGPSHPQARYFTREDKRDLIDLLLNL